MKSEKAVPPTIETIFRPGQSVAGKYCLDHPIAAGNTGEVWAGVDLRTRKRIALKAVSHPRVSTQEDRALFRLEALTASRIIHPNLVTVFDVVDHASKTWIAMELLQGQDLGTYLACQRLPAVEEAVALLVPAMSAVAVANARGVFHRAISPTNIFLCMGPDGRPTATKVLNLGTSLVAVKDIPQHSNTVQLVPRRTRAYKSLAEDQGASAVDDRPDVYGFGLTLFEALAGQGPFDGPAAGAELPMRMSEDPVPKLTRFRPDLHSDMDEIIARATARNPSDRFPTLDDFIAALLWEQILPPSPMLRHARGPTGLIDLVVEEDRHSAPSKENDAGITSALLYALSRADADRPDNKEQLDQALSPPKTASRQRPKPHPRGDGLRPANSPRPDDDTMRLVFAMRTRARLRNLLVVTSIAAAVAGVAWVLIPTRPQHPQGVRLPEAVVVPVSMYKAQPVGLPPREVAERAAQSKLSALEAEPQANVPATSASHSEPRRRATHATVPSEPSMSSPPPVNSPRAGQLSPDDF